MPEAQITLAVTDAGVWAGSAQWQASRWQLTTHAFRSCHVPAALRPETDLDELAEAAGEAIQAIPASTAPARLVVPGTWVLTHTMDLAGRKFDRAAAGFEFEGYLPAALEDLTCIFLEADGLDPQSTTRRYLGLAAPTRPLRRLLDRLAAGGLFIDRIVPDLFRPPPSEAGAGSMYVWCDRDHGSGVTFGSSGRRIAAIRAFRAPDLAEELTAWLQRRGSDDGHPMRIHLCGRTGSGLAERLRTALDAAVQADFEWLEASPPTPLLLPAGSDESLNLGVEALAFGGRLRTTTRRLTRCGLWAALLLLGLGLHARLQNREYHRAIAAIQTQEQLIYGRVFPRQAVPPGAALRLASERRRMEGLTRSTAGRTSGPRVDLLDRLRRIIAAIPAQTRICVQELHLDRRELTLRGLTTSHRDAEQIGAGLRGVPGVQPRPPRSDAVREGGVVFSLRAEWTEPPAPGPSDPTDKPLPLASLAGPKEIQP